ncbi:hypothetical protein GLAREA_10901 [Glarea lozoyensis ATCC 20868]|uniref:Uncharacterized protein n=1 Tax=Glarea lozoyensis (strain ATCC 20868 / MF5171) TaxID=1116229 RepID=S3DDM1_GLAL2|nr:uncharacterized protein GLAREA_10901 [Glarea lozoyensis ATCC 20868]EPE35204.1 hypothetical protein GLAREA_10901 [Glarea lozoyensis ATCC 20868]
MNGIFNHIKALNSEASLTLSQQHELEPYNCIDPDCVFPYGPPCNECKEAQRRKEEHRAAILAARIIWVDDNDLKPRPSTTALHRKERKKEAARQRWFNSGSSGGSELSSQASSQTLRSESSSQTLRSVDDSKVELVKKDSAITLRAQKSVVSLSSSQQVGNDGAERVLRRSQTFHNIRDPKPDNQTNNQSLSECTTTSVVPSGNRRSSISSTSLTSTIVPTPPQAILPSSEEPSDTSTTPTEASENSSTTQDHRLKTWLTDLPSPTRMTNPYRPLSQLNTTEFIDISSGTPQKIVKATHTCIEIVKTRQPRTGACPLCANPLGDPRDQHLVKCRFARDEKARWEEMRVRMEGREM